MSQQVLTLLEGNARGPQTMAKGVLQVVNPDLGKADSLAGLLPGCRHHPTQAASFVRENVLRVPFPLPVDDCSSHFIQLDYALLSIFRKPLRDDENGRLELRNEDFPVLTQLTHLILSGPGVDLEKHHALKMLRKLREQASLLLPTQRIGLSCPPWNHLN